MGLAGLAIEQVNERLTSSLTTFQPGISDQVKTRKALLDAIMKRKKLYSGGTEVGLRLRYKKAAKIGQSGGVGAFSYYDELNVTPTDTVKASGEKWSNFQVPVALSHEEIYENDGEHAFDRFKENTEFAMDDLSDNLNDVAWGISGGDGNKLPTPIPDVISGSDALTLYGLPKASNTFLYSQDVTNVGDLETELIDAMSEGESLVIDNSPNKGDVVDLWITHREVWLGLKKVIPQYVQLNSFKKADLGFSEVIYNGKPVRWDSDCPLDSDNKYQMFGLMLKYWEVAIRRQWNFKTTQFFDMMPNQAASVAQLLIGMAIICNNPRTNVRIKGIEL